MPIEDITTKGELRRFIEATVPDFRPLINQIQGQLAGEGIPPQVRARRTSNQSIANAAQTAVQFDIESYDLSPEGVAGMHDTVTNNSRLTAQVAGLYSCHYSVRFAGNINGFREAFMRNNAGVVIEGYQLEEHGVATDFAVTGGGDFRLAAGEYVEVFVQQTSGAALNLTALQTFSAHWVSP